MDTDLAFVIGLVVVGFSVPSIISAWSDSRAPRASVVTILIGFGLIIYALQVNGSAYAFESIPDVFLRVVARYVP